MIHSAAFTMHHPAPARLPPLASTLYKYSPVMPHPGDHHHHAVASAATTAAMLAGSTQHPWVRLPSLALARQGPVHMHPQQHAQAAQQHLPPTAPSSVATSPIHFALPNATASSDANHAAIITPTASAHPSPRVPPPLVAPLAIRPSSAAKPSEPSPEATAPPKIKRKRKSVSAAASTPSDPDMVAAANALLSVLSAQPLIVVQPAAVEAPEPEVKRLRIDTTLLNAPSTSSMPTPSASPKPNVSSDATRRRIHDLFIRDVTLSRHQRRALLGDSDDSDLDATEDSVPAPAAAATLAPRAAKPKPAASAAAKRPVRKPASPPPSRRGSLIAPPSPSYEPARSPSADAPQRIDRFTPPAEPAAAAPRRAAVKVPTLPPQVDLATLHGDTRGSPTVTWPKGGPMTFAADEPGLDLLTKEEASLCRTLRLVPTQYLTIKEAIIGATYTRPSFRKKEVRRWFPIDVNKINKLYDWFLEVGWVPKEEAEWARRRDWLKEIGGGDLIDLTPFP